MVNPTAILNDLRRARSWLSRAAAIGLIPWIIYLAHSLPRHYDTGHWRGLWVGFDVLEVVFLLTTAVLGVLGRERFAGVRKLFRLIQLEQVAERIVQEGLVPGAWDERDPVHLDALPLQVGDGRIYVVDSDREVVRTQLLRVGLHQVHLLAAGVEPVSGAEIGARQLRHAEHVAIKSETLLRVGDADGDMVHTGWLHHSILPRTQPYMTFRIARHI